MSHGFLLKATRIVFAALVAAALPGGTVRAETLTIGIIGPLTGGGAAWGLAAVEAGRILAEEVNARGGLAVGGKSYQVQVVAYDDKYKAAESVAVYDRLVHQDGVRFLIIQTGTATAALKQKVEADKVVALTSSYGGEALARNTRYMFRLYSDPDQYTGPFVRWVKDSVRGRRVVTLNPNDATGWHVAEASVRALKANGFEVLASELFERTQEDLQPLLTKIIAMKPDIIELGSTPPATAGLLVRQARELGYDKLFTKMGGPSPRDIIAAAGAKAAEGTITLLYADPSNAGYRRLAAAYRKTRGHDGNEIIVPYYDGLNVLLHAIQQAGTVEDTSRVAAAFSKALPMRSIQGEEVRLGGAKDYGSDTQFLTVNYIGVIRDGAPVVVGKTR